MVFALWGCGRNEGEESDVAEGMSTSSEADQSVENYPGVADVTDESGNKVTEVNGVATTGADDYQTTKVPDEGKSENGVVTENRTTTNSVNSAGNNQTTTSAVKPAEGNKTTTRVTATADNKTTTKSDKNDKEKSFTVTFKAYDGKVLKTEKVKSGADATAPDAPERKGFRFVKWDTYYKEVKTDIITTAVYEELTEPTLIVDTVKASGKEVIVKVSTLNNPGLLAMLLKVNYDETAMTLKKIENASSMAGYTFTAPRNLKSGCNVAWNIVEVPESVIDGDILLLHFEMNENVSQGSYNVSVTCFDGAFDSNYEAVKFDVIDGSVII